MVGSCVRMGCPARGISATRAAWAWAGVSHALALLAALWVVLGAAATARAQTASPTPSTAPAASRTLIIEAALAAEADTPQFPVNVPTQIVALPDDWPVSRPESQGPVWYRVAFRVDEDRRISELLAVYIARVCTNLEVFVNGELVHSGGRMSGRITHNCNHPQLVSLPSALLKGGLNALDIKVVGEPLSRVASQQRAGGLSQLEVGLLRDLAPRQARQEALQAGIPQGVSGVLVLMGGFLLILGLANRREAHLAWFGMLCTVWGVALTRLWVRNLPVPNLPAELVQATLIALLAWAAVQFLLCHVRQQTRWASIGLPVQALVMPLSLALAVSSDALHLAARFWYALLALEVVAAAAVFLRARRQASPRAVWLELALFALVLVAVLLEFVGLRGTVAPLVALAAQLATPVILLLVGLSLVHAHGRALQTAEQNRALLEARVAEISAEVERNFEQLAELRVEQVTQRERKRIAGDLHDDLGAKLLTIVHTSESDRIANLAREALDEMRLSVRGLTGKAVRLGDAMGDWRAEVVSRLQQAGIQCDWTMPLEEFPQTLAARTFVQTTRILREAVSNVIKHSGATACTVHCTAEDGLLLLVIRDNGEGIAMEPDGRLDRGHGVSSMKHRARQLQGQCLVESAVGQGTVIRLSVPVAQVADDA